MMTVKEVSRLTGVTVRALQYYDKIGLLSPAGYTDSGYRLYDDTALEKLGQILLLRELEFPLKDIKKILSNPDYDKGKAVEDQIRLLTMRKQRIEKLIEFAREINTTGVNNMNFKVFDSDKIDRYSKEAKEKWGGSDAYKEFEVRHKNKSPRQVKQEGSDIMAICASFGLLKELDVNDEKVTAQVKKLQDFITENYYTCTDEILRGLGQLYGAGSEFTENINAAGGRGAAEYASKAIRAYCDKK